MEEEQGREEKEELRQPSLGGDKGGRTLEFAQMSAMSRKYSASQLSSPPKSSSTGRGWAGGRRPGMNVSSSEPCRSGRQADMITYTCTHQSVCE